MTDVISFQVQPILYVPATGADVMPSETTPINNGTFDSGLAAGYKVGTQDAVIKGLIITIRGWDRSMGVARQATVVQDM